MTEARHVLIVPGALGVHEYHATDGVTSANEQHLALEGMPAERWLDHTHYGSIVVRKVPKGFRTFVVRAAHRAHITNVNLSGWREQHFPVFAFEQFGEFPPSVLFTTADRVDVLREVCGAQFDTLFEVRQVPDVRVTGFKP